MIARRDLLLGGACLLAAAGAEAMTPRGRFVLLKNGALNELLPASFGPWVSQDVSDLVAPKTEDSLETKLYSETLERVYRRPDTGEEVMMLMAHGDTQSNDLQLHRPETCYPAFGFELTRNQGGAIPLGAGADIPVRRIVADAPGRRENIIYWTRLGAYLPASATEQRMDRLRTALHGYVADGLLARFSALGPDPDRAFATLTRFIEGLINSVPANARASLIGPQLAQKLGAGRA